MACHFSGNTYVFSRRICGSGPRIKYFSWFSRDSQLIGNRYVIKVKPLEPDLLHKSSRCMCAMYIPLRKLFIPHLFTNYVHTNTCAHCPCTYSYCMYSPAKYLQTRALNLAPYANVLKMVTRSETKEILAEKK